MSEPEILALIPARGGSKGIPRKNIRPFAGQPLIAYSIAAGLQANAVIRVIVTTDDEQIAEVARSCGAETPFLRPAELAQDRTTDLPVFQHALRWLAEQEDYHPDVVVHLRPTTPIRPPDLVDRSVALLLAHPEADSVRGITPGPSEPVQDVADGWGGQTHPPCDNRSRDRRALQLAAPDITDRLHPYRPDRYHPPGHHPGIELDERPDHSADPVRPGLRCRPGYAGGLETTPKKEFCMTGRRWSGRGNRPAACLKPSACWCLILTAF